jgi:predicted nicotinamide N-methyase
MARRDGPLPAPVPLVVQLPEVEGVEPPHALTIFEDPAGSGPGGALWDAAVVLAQHLHSLTLRGARVLELGAGTGLPGLAAARLGAHVTLTDRPRALPLLRRNAEHNGLAVTVLELEWGCTPPEWSQAQTPPFQLVLGADVVCHDESMAPLIATLRQLLQGGGEALICNKCRDEAEHKFWEAAANEFNVELLQEGLPAAPRDGDELPVMLYRLWAK